MIATKVFAVLFKALITIHVICLLSGSIVVTIGGTDVLLPAQNYVQSLPVSQNLKPIILSQSKLNESDGSKLDQNQKKPKQPKSLFKKLYTWLQQSVGTDSEEPITEPKSANDRSANDLTDKKSTGRYKLSTYGFLKQLTMILVAILVFVAMLVFAAFLLEQCSQEERLPTLAKAHIQFLFALFVVHVVGQLAVHYFVPQPTFAMSFFVWNLDSFFCGLIVGGAALGTLGPIILFSSLFDTFYCAKTANKED